MEYKKCYVAFIDVLGFKECVKNNEFDVVFRALEDLRVEGSAWLKALHDKFRIDSVNIFCVSDSIVMSIEQNLENALDAIVWMCAAFQTTLLLNDHMLMRGAITCGDFYMNTDNHGTLLFGPAYVKAVEVEKNSCLPRVVLDDSVDITASTNKSFITQDEKDRVFFVDYMEMAKITSCAKLKLEKTKESIEKSLDDYKNTESIYLKYAWQKNYNNKALEDSPELSSCIIK